MHQIFPKLHQQSYTFICSLQKFFHLSFKLASWDHHTAIAFRAFDSNVRTHSDDFPFICPAGMRFFHLHDISQRKLFLLHNASPFRSNFFPFFSVLLLNDTTIPMIPMFPDQLVSLAVQTKPLVLDRESQFPFRQTLA